MGFNVDRTPSSVHIPYESSITIPYESSIQVISTTSTDMNPHKIEWENPRHPSKCPIEIQEKQLHRIL